jgi:hypothetical protein
MNLSSFLPRKSHKTRSNLTSIVVILSLIQVSTCICDLFGLSILNLHYTISRYQFLDFIPINFACSIQISYQVSGPHPKWHSLKGVSTVHSLAPQRIKVYQLLRKRVSAMRLHLCIFALSAALTSYH